MSTQAASTTSYDEIPFPTQPLQQSHPDRLAGVARLFGLNPPPVERCRVLEVGCGTGANLIPMAERHPGSRFVGIDIAGSQLAAGQIAIDALGLTNISLRQASIAGLDPSLGPFDYIICHGVFSWITPELQDQLLALIKARLAPAGVAYVSYNTYPGWHFRGVIRQLACQHTPADAPPAQRIERARHLLEFFSYALGEEPAPIAELLKHDIDVALQQEDGYLFHEYMEDENHPLYFHQFNDRAVAHGLQYLGEATPAMMFGANFGPAVEQQLLSISSDVIAIEQHMDLIRNRAFRQTLLCHQGFPIKRFLSAESLAGLYLAGKIHPESVACDLQSNQPERFVTASNSVITTPSPAVKAALFVLGARWPRAIGFGELVEAASQQLGNPSQGISAEDRRNLGDNLVQCLAVGLIDLYAAPDDFVTEVSQYPRASRLAALQARLTANVTNRRHQALTLDEVTQNALPFLDGQHDREALLGALIKAVDEGRLSILLNGIPASRGESVSGILKNALDQSLTRLASEALLVG
jgi:methyltransferase-like protein/SAM-dependent methyltransferase